MPRLRQRWQMRWQAWGLPPRPAGAAAGLAGSRGRKASGSSCPAAAAAAAARTGGCMRRCPSRFAMLPCCASSLDTVSVPRCRVWGGCRMLATCHCRHCRCRAASPSSTLGANTPSLIPTTPAHPPSIALPLPLLPRHALQTAWWSTAATGAPCLNWRTLRAPTATPASSTSKWGSAPGTPRQTGATSSAASEQGG